MHARLNDPDRHLQYKPHEGGGGGGGRRCESEGDGVTEQRRKWGRAKANSERRTWGLTLGKVSSTRLRTLVRLASPAIPPITPCIPCYGGYIMIYHCHIP